MNDFIKLINIFYLIVLLLVVVLSNQINVVADGECKGGIGGTCVYPMCCSK